MIIMYTVECHTVCWAVLTLSSFRMIEIVDLNFRTIKNKKPFHTLIIFVKRLVVIIQNAAVPTSTLDTDLGC